LTFVRSVGLLIETSVEPKRVSTLRQLREKLLNLDALAARAAELRAQNTALVLCHGCFDPVHIGHMRHFREARKQGEVLVVTVTPDRFVDKGPTRPVFSEDLRAESIASLEMVDYATINRWPTAVEAIRLLKPHVYVKGGEYRAGDASGKLDEELTALAEHGGRAHFTGDIVFSSTALIETFLRST